jgi:hypothetical protein
VIGCLDISTTIIFDPVDAVNYMFIWLPSVQLAGLDIESFARVLVAWAGLPLVRPATGQRHFELGQIGLAAVVLLCVTERGAAAFVAAGGLHRLAELLYEFQNVPHSAHVRLVAAALDLVTLVLGPRIGASFLGVLPPPRPDLLGPPTWAQPPTPSPSPSPPATPVKAPDPKAASPKCSPKKKQLKHSQMAADLHALPELGPPTSPRPVTPRRRPSAQTPRTRAAGPIKSSPSPPRPAAHSSTSESIDSPICRSASGSSVSLASSDPFSHDLEASRMEASRISTKGVSYRAPLDSSREKRHSSQDRSHEESDAVPAGPAEASSSLSLGSGSDNGAALAPVNAHEAVVATGETRSTAAAAVGLGNKAQRKGGNSAGDAPVVEAAKEEADADVDNPRGGDALRSLPRESHEAGSEGVVRTDVADAAGEAGRVVVRQDAGTDGEAAEHSDAAEHSEAALDSEASKGAFAGAVADVDMAEGSDRGASEHDCEGDLAVVTGAYHTGALPMFQTLYVWSIHSLLGPLGL